MTLIVPIEFIPLITSLLFALAGCITKFVYDLGSLWKLENLDQRFKLIKMLLFTILVTLALQLPALEPVLNTYVNIPLLLGLNNLDLLGTAINYFGLGLSSNWFLSKLMKLNIFKEAST
jgi:hypothetical protein